MRHQAVRTFALMLGVVLAGAPAVRAGTITFGDAVRGFGAGGQFRPASEVRLRLGAQQGGAVQAQGGTTQGGAASSEQSGAQQPSGAGGSAVTSAPAGDPTLSQSGSQVQTVDLGDVTGTVCDCGEIPPIDSPARRGGIPWWPLVGIPLICVTGICTPDDNPETPNTPNTPETPIPEPMSLLLFGSGLLALGAGARRRYGRRQPGQEIVNATAEEV